MQILVFRGCWGRGTSVYGSVSGPAEPCRVFMFTERVGVAGTPAAVVQTKQRERERQGETFPAEDGGSGSRWKHVDADQSRRQRLLWEETWRWTLFFSLFFPFFITKREAELQLSVSCRSVHFCRIIRAKKLNEPLMISVRSTR